MFGNKILDFKDELLKDLNTLLSFESVDGEKNDECDNALNFILKRAEDFGLTGERTTDKSGHITLGDSGKLCGVLTHLDVVPAGNSWSVPPYALTEKDGRLYGRGIADDKGAALVTLYCLKAICVLFTARVKKRVWRIWKIISRKIHFPTWHSLPTATTAFALPKRVFFSLKSAHF